MLGGHIDRERAQLDFVRGRFGLPGGELRHHRDPVAGRVRGRRRATGE